MTDLEIQKYIESNCRNEHGEPMMNEQTFYEGAKWYKDKVVNKLTIPDVRLSFLAVENTDLKWQTRDEMEIPTNPLQKLQEVFAFTSRDCSEDKMIAFIYGVVMGWDDDSYAEIKDKHNWTDKDIKLQKMWHKNYQKAWELFMCAKANEA